MKSKDRSKHFVLQLLLAIFGVGGGVWFQSFLRSHHAIGNIAEGAVEYSTAYNATTSRSVSGLPVPLATRLPALLNSPALTSGRVGTAVRLSPQGRERIRQCSPDLIDENLATLDDFQANFLKHSAQGKWVKELLWQNRHFRSASGIERRVRVYLKERNEDPSQLPHYHIQLLQVNDDGLPERVSIPVEEQVDPESKFVIEKIGDSEEIYESHEDRYRLLDGAHLGATVATVRYENNQVTTLEYSNEYGFLRCLAQTRDDEVDCQCHRAVELN
jgi:hypothetical protein